MEVWKVIKYVQVFLNVYITIVKLKALYFTIYLEVVLKRLGKGG